MPWRRSRKFSTKCSEVHDNDPEHLTKRLEHLTKRLEHLTKRLEYLIMRAKLQIMRAGFSTKCAWGVDKKAENVLS